MKPRRQGEAREGPALAARPHDAFFRPDAVQESQLRSAPAWLADRTRPPEFGFAFSPASLPLPWTYGVKLLSSRFDRRSQSWGPEAADPGWAAPEEGSAVGEVRLRGRVPAGEVVLPVPLYGRVVDVAASPPARTATARDGRTLLFAERATDLSYRVVLEQAPDYALEDDGLVDDLPAPPASLLAATVPDSELPDEVLWFLDELAGRGEGAHGRALAVREFVRTRYRYDPSYLEDEGVARWLREVSAGRPNAHLAALHAGRDGRWLGRGVCYDLNVLACELLRRAGVPAAVATGWPFTGGSLAEPDHLWAMALVPTAAGWRWAPIDAATTAEGRPLQTPRRPAGPWRVAPSRSDAIAPRERGGRRDRKNPARVPATDLAAGRPAARASVKVKAPPRLPVGELVDLARQLEALTGERFGSPDRLRKRFELLLRDPRRLKELLALLRE